VLNAIQQEAAFEGETWLAKAREAVRRVRRELEPLLTRLNSQYKVDSITWYRRLWQDPGLWERVAGELKAPSGAGESLRTLDEGCIAFEDVVPLMYLKGELEATHCGGVSCMWWWMKCRTTPPCSCAY